MTDSRSPAHAGPPTSEEAFELLGDEIRASVLQVLSEQRGRGLPPTLSFSELHERIDPDVPSSQFNYHLDRLVGSFLERREEGSAQLVDRFVDSREGYALRPDGTFLTRVIEAVTADHDATVAPFRTDFDCHYCGTVTEATYRNRIFKLQCPDCEHLYVYTLTPPGVVADDPDPETLLDRAAAYARRKYTQFARGYCPLCANGVEPEPMAPEAVNWPHDDAVETLVFRRCDHCGNANYASLGTELSADPGVIGFCERHGLDLTDTPTWKVEFVATDRHVTVESTDPWRATLAVPFEDETLRLRVDEELTVLDRERRG